MMTAHERVFPARLDSLQAACEFAEAVCAAAGVAHADTMRLVLVIEELFTNTVTHGHGGDSDAPVRVQLVLAQAHIELHYEDRAPPFDPLRQLDSAAPHLDAGAESRTPGGLGVHLVARVADRLDYLFVDGANRLRIVLPRRG
jgi:serine/threonine-protein kinase RsbW